MFNIKKGVVLIAVVVLISVFVYYWYAKKIFQANRNEDVVPMVEVPSVGSKNVSAVVRYMATEDQEDALRFTLTLDKQGTITDVTTLDAETNEVPEKKKPFNQQVSVMIIGKKLSELSAVDNVAKSTLTTNAFNSVIDQLKAQL